MIHVLPMPMELGDPQGGIPYTTITQCLGPLSVLSLRPYFELVMVLAFQPTIDLLLDWPVSYRL